ncbi:glycosyltransferase family 4 protein [Alkalihalobacillus sp. TS-13]|uniref:glycosyltransferase family 4 protein n=1 Tax=Alkalihalobacillus sp. TS-13 TaxID=2842455 RepID=UPI001C883AD6|nr:glycosyltransferase family 4 protein [Alkalihalobacillus sp. TS-13]
MEEKKVLLITQYFPPDITAAAFRLVDMYEALNRENFKVTVITSLPQKAQLEEIQEDTNVFRVKLKKIKQKRKIFYIFNYLQFMIKVLYIGIFTLKKEKFDYIIVTSPPIFVGLAGIIISKIRNIVLISDIRDLWPESILVNGILKKSSVIYKIFKKMEILLYNYSNKITCVSKEMKKYITKQEINDEKISVLYNGVSEKYINYHNKLFYTKSFSENSTFKIMYAGNIGIYQNLDMIIQLNQYLFNKNEKQKYEFVLIGEGIERKSLEEKARKLGMSNVKFLGPKTKEDVISLLNNADALFLPLVEDKILEKTIPSKLFDYLLHNKPIITNISGEGKEILDKLQIGIYFKASSVENLYKALNYLNSNYNLLESNARENNHYVKNNYNRIKSFREFCKTLN